MYESLTHVRTIKFLLFIEKPGKPLENIASDGGHAKVPGNPHTLSAS